MIDDPRLAELGQFTPEGKLTPGYGDHYLFLVGRDDCHSILLHLIGAEKLGFDFNQYGYADEEINQAILGLLKNPSIMVQGTLDKSQAGGVHEKQILSLDEMQEPIAFANSIAIGQSATHQISHTKGGVLVGQGLWFEGSTNWSKAGEGIGISLRADVKNPKGFAAQNNSLVVSANPVGLLRFKTQLLAEHRIAQAQVHVQQSV
jgi:hypothetical protein